MGYKQPSNEEIAKIVNNSKTIAIVGVSDKPDRPSYQVAQFLKETGLYQLFFVNPALTELFGAPVYKTLEDIPVPIDIVDVFRKPSELEPVFESAQRIGAKNIWLQLGIENDELGSAAQSHGLGVVMNRCLKIDYDFFKTFS